MALIVQPSGPHWSELQQMPFPSTLAVNGDMPDAKADRVRFVTTAAAKGRTRNAVLTKAAAAILHNKNVPILLAALRLKFKPASGGSDAEDDSFLSGVLRVLVHCSKASQPFATAVLGDGQEDCETIFRLAAEPSKDPFSQGLACKLLEALVRRRACPLASLSTAVRVAIRIVGTPSSTAAAGGNSSKTTTDLRILSSAFSVLVSVFALYPDVDRVYPMEDKDDVHQFKSFVTSSALKILQNRDTVASLRSILCYHNSSHGADGPGERSRQSLVYVDGCQFGIRTEGILDPPILLLHHMMDIFRSSRIGSAAIADMAKNFLKHRLLSPLCRQLSAGGSDEMSEKGLYHLLKLLRLVLVHMHTESAGGGDGGGGSGGGGSPTSEKNGSLEAILQEDVISCTVSLLSPAHLSLLQQWHETVDKTAPDAADLLHASVSLLQVPFSMSDSPNSQIIQVQQQMYSSDMIHRVAKAMEELHSTLVLDVKTDNTAAALSMSLLSRLVLSSRHFERQFVNVGALRSVVSAGCLEEKHSQPSIIVDALSIVSQLARASQDYNEAIEQSGDIFAYLQRLLLHPQAAVRAKTCNVLGNICRHSAYFYEELSLPRGAPPSLYDHCRYW
jgi:hypothetical protein